MTALTTQVKVGLFALISIVVIALLNVRLSKSPSLLGRTSQHYLYVENASGLIKNAYVKMAGVKVGVIKRISLDQGRARIDIIVQGDLNLTEDATVELVTNGILGDKFVSIIGGSPTAPLIPSGGEIKNFVSTGSLGDVMDEVGKVSSALQDIALALKKATLEGSNETPMGRIIHNIENITENLAQVTEENGGRINRVMRGMEELTETLRLALGEEKREEFGGAWEGVVRGIDKFDRSLANIEEVTGKLNEGQGTIGRLLNDETTVNGINKAVNNLNRVLGGALNLRTSFDYHSEYMTDRQDIQSFVGIKIQPGLDRYYYVGVIQDPYGITETTITDTTKTTREDQNPSTVTHENEEKKKTNKDAIKFTAVLAKNFYNLTVKGGLIQSSGGFGLDYHLLRNKLLLSAEMFKFSDPNLRIFARWSPYKGIYLVGGGDSILKREDRDFNPFVGAGISITNDDLNILATQFFR